MCKFPDDPNTEYTSVSSFFFLRFICPCLVSPVAFGLASRPPSKPVTRGLTLIAKVVQNMANLVEFGEKEMFMNPLNPFIVENLDRMKIFLTGLAEDDEGRSEGEGREIPLLPKRGVLLNQGVYLGRLFRLFSKNLEKVRTYAGKGDEVVNEELKERVVEAVETTEQKLKEVVYKEEVEEEEVFLEEPKEDKKKGKKEKKEEKKGKKEEKKGKKKTGGGGLF